MCALFAFPAFARMHRPALLQKLRIATLREKVYWSVILGLKPTLHLIPILYHADQLCANCSTHLATMPFHSPPGCAMQGLRQWLPTIPCAPLSALDANNVF